MKLRFYINVFAFIFTMFPISLFALEDQERYIVGRQPPSFIGRISRSTYEFFVQTASSQSTWGVFNGESYYDLADIKQKELSKIIVREAYEEGRRNVWLLDIGAGNFESCDAWASDFKEMGATLEGMTIHIVGIRGEPYKDKAVKRDWNCKIYKFGLFMIEDFEEEFRKRGLGSVEFDLTISRWTMRHLFNPLGTFMAAFNKTRTGGFLNMDWFHYLYEEEKLDSRYDVPLVSRGHLLDVLIHLKVPFILNPRSANALPPYLDAFLIQKGKESPSVLPLEYVGLEECDARYFQVHAGYVVKFRILDSDFKASALRESYSAHRTRFFVNSPFLQWLHANNLLVDESYFKEFCFMQNGLLTLSSMKDQDTQEKSRDFEKFRSPKSREEKERNIEEARRQARLERQKKDLRSGLLEKLKKQDFEEVQTLFHQGVEVNNPWDEEDSFLDSAITGYFPTGAITLLLNNGAKIKHLSKSEAVYTAIRTSSSEDDIKSLLKVQEYKPSNFDACLWASVARGEKGLIDLFLSMGANLNAFVNCHPIIFEASFDPVTWNFLIEKGAKGHRGEELEKR
ncbi:MAG: hypothetical protein JSS34_00240 [Proteobacteria bacterium]|nr:hypothetical protein [Pseudomonadota bacterium]